MNNFIEEKKTLAILLAVIFFLLLGVLYMYWVKPLKEEVAQVEQNVELLETEIQLLEAELQKTDEAADPDGQYYQWTKKLPLDRHVDELILSLQEIEILSESRIENISFNNYDGQLSESDQIHHEEDAEQMDHEEEELNETESTDDEATEESEEALAEPPVSEVIHQLPENVRLLTLQLDVVSPNFEQSQKFLKEIETLERIIRVDALSFNKPGEREILESDEEEIPISMNVTMTTFYYVE